MNPPTNSKQTQQETPSLGNDMTVPSPAPATDAEIIAEGIYAVLCDQNPNVEKHAEKILTELNAKNGVCERCNGTGIEYYNVCGDPESRNCELCAKKSEGSREAVSVVTQSEPSPDKAGTGLGGEDLSMNLQEHSAGWVKRNFGENHPVVFAKPVTALRARVTELEAENGRLRELGANSASAHKWAKDELTALQSANEKLTGQVGRLREALTAFKAADQRYWKELSFEARVDRDDACSRMFAELAALSATTQPPDAISREKR